MTIHLRRASKEQPYLVHRKRIILDTTAFKQKKLVAIAEELAAITELANPHLMWLEGVL